MVSPVLSTSLYFVVFGAAIGSRISEVDGVSYGAFIVPGLIMLSLLTQSITNASFGIYFPRFVGTIYEVLSAPVSYLEIVTSYVGAAATKSIMLGVIILATADLFVPIRIAASGADGRVPGADSRDVQPLRLHHRHLGRQFREAAACAVVDRYAADLPGWQFLFHRHAAAALAKGRADQPDRVSRYSGFRWSFFGTADVDVWVSFGMAFVVLAICLAIVNWMFRTGYRLKS